MSTHFEPAVPAAEGDRRDIFTTIARLRAMQQVDVADYCPRAQQLLFNEIVANHFRNAEVPAAAHVARNLNKILADPPAAIKDKMMEVDQIKREDQRQADALKRWAVVYIRRFIDSTGHPLPGVLAEEQDPNIFLQMYFKIENENNDLRQFCAQALSAANGYLGLMETGKDVGDRVAEHFMPLYIVLRAAELLAGPAPVVEAPQPAQPRSLSMLDSGPRRILIAFAGRVSEHWKGAIKTIAFTNLPDEIKNAIQEAVEKVTALEPAEVEARAQKYYIGIARELDLIPYHQIHDRLEIFARTFGNVQAMINAWEKDQKVPDLRQLQEYLETGLIFLRRLYS